MRGFLLVLAVALVAMACLALAPSANAFANDDTTALVATSSQIGMTSDTGTEIFCFGTTMSDQPARESTTCRSTEVAGPDVTAMTATSRGANAPRGARDAVKERGVRLDLPR